MLKKKHCITHNIKNVKIKRDTIESKLVDTNVNTLFNNIK